MFFPKLGQSSAYSVDRQLVAELDECLGGRSASDVLVFGPEAVTSQTGRPPESILPILFEAVELGILKPYYTLHCPECGHFYASMSKLSDLPVDEVECLDCQTHFSRSDELVRLTFELIAKPEPNENSSKKVPA